MRLTTASTVTWQQDSGLPGWWHTDETHPGYVASIDTDNRKIVVHMSDVKPSDLAELAALTGSLGLAFPATDAEFATGIMAGDLAPWTVSADDGTWLLVASF